VSPEELVAAALQARRHAYSPYSSYAVGAALEGESGHVYTGCNVENISYGLTICAERNAVASAICAGERRFRALAVATADGGTPCGACRQVLAEFAGPDLAIYAATPDGNYRYWTLGQLLPEAFHSPAVGFNGGQSEP